VQHVGKKGAHNRREAAEHGDRAFSDTCIKGSVILSRYEHHSKETLVEKTVIANSVTTEALKSFQYVSQRAASGKVRKKYRLHRYAQAQKVVQRKGLRRKVQKNNSCGATEYKLRQNNSEEQFVCSMKENSRCLPGEADVSAEKRSGNMNRVAK